MFFKFFFNWSLGQPIARTVFELHKMQISLEKNFEDLPVLLLKSNNSGIVLRPSECRVKVFVLHVRCHVKSDWSGTTRTVRFCDVPFIPNLNKE